MRGSATFDLRSEPTHLFEVNTDEAQLIALGTRFRITADNEVTTVVMEHRSWRRRR